MPLGCGTGSPAAWVTARRGLRRWAGSSRLCPSGLPEDREELLELSPVQPRSREVRRNARLEARRLGLPQQGPQGTYECLRERLDGRAVMKLLAVDPAHRQLSATDMSGDLQQVLAPPPRAAERSRRVCGGPEQVRVAHRRVEPAQVEEADLRPGKPSEPVRALFVAAQVAQQ